MRTRMSVASVLLGLLLAGSARAADHGVNIAWDACGATGVSSKAFACGTNEGEAVLYLSFMLSNDETSKGPFYAWSAIVDAYTSRAGTQPLPDWWQFGSGGCREGMLACTFAPVEDAACTALPGFPDTSWSLYYSSDNNFLTVRCLGIIHGGDDLIELDAGVEYLMGRIGVRFAKSTGADSCTGCSTSVIIILSVVELYGDARSVMLETPLRQQFVYWSGNTVPARATSWGQIKGMYR